MFTGTGGSVVVVVDVVDVVDVEVVDVDVGIVVDAAKGSVLVLDASFVVTTSTTGGSVTSALDGGRRATRGRVTVVVDPLSPAAHDAANRPTRAHATISRGLRGATMG